MIADKLQWKKIAVYVKEKGFTYSTRMQELETKFLNAYDNGGDKKELLKIAKKLCNCYRKSCKKLDSNYNRIAQLYGGVLFDLIERDTAADNNEFSMNDVISKLDDISESISSMENDIKDLLSGHDEEVLREHEQLKNIITDVEQIVQELGDKYFEE